MPNAFAMSAHMLNPYDIFRFLPFLHISKFSLFKYLSEICMKKYTEIIYFI